MIIKHQIAFKLRPYGKDKNIYQIQMHTTFNSQRIITSTGCQIFSLDAWDTNEGMAVSDYRGPKGITGLSINKTLRAQKDQRETAFKYFEANDIFPTRSELLEKYEARVKGITPSKPEPEKKKKEVKPTEPDFFKVFDTFTYECGEKNAWTEATHEKMAALMLGKLYNFRHKVHLKDIIPTKLTRA